MDKNFSLYEQQSLWGNVVPPHPPPARCWDRERLEWGDRARDGEGINFIPMGLVPPGTE